MKLVIKDGAFQLLLVLQLLAKRFPPARTFLYFEPHKVKLTDAFTASNWSPDEHGEAQRSEESRVALKFLVSSKVCIIKFVVEL